MLTEGLILEGILQDIYPSVTRVEIEEKPMSSILAALDYAKLKYLQKVNEISDIEQFVRLIGDRNIQELKGDDFNFSMLYALLNELKN